MEWLLKMLPTDRILRWVAKQLTGLDDYYINLAIAYVERYDKENLPGYEKRQKVYQELRKSLDTVADWAINFIIELAVAFVRNKKD